MDFSNLSPEEVEGPKAQNDGAGGPEGVWGFRGLGGLGVWGFRGLGVSGLGV